MQDMHDDDRAPSAMLLDRRAPFVGGAQDSEVASSEFFDPARTPSAGPPARRPSRERELATTLLDGRVLVAGGSLPNGSEPARLIARSCSIRRRRRSAPRVGWSSDGSMTALPCSLRSRSRHGRIRGRQWRHVGGVLPPTWAPVVGRPAGPPSFRSGGHAAAGRARARLRRHGLDVDDEPLDPSTVGSSRARSTANPRYGHTSVRLADGRALIIGGTDGNQAMASVEPYDPVTDRISTTGPP